MIEQLLICVCHYSIGLNLEKRNERLNFTLFNNKTQIPEFITITTWKTHEITDAKDNWKNWNLEKESFLVFDRWYYDFNWFNELDKGGIYFFTRIKTNTNYSVIKTNKIFDNLKFLKNY